MREASARDRERKSAKVGVSFSISEVGSEGGNARYAVEVLRDLRGKAGGLEDTDQPRRVKSQLQILRRKRRAMSKERTGGSCYR